MAGLSMWQLALLAAAGLGGLSVLLVVARRESDPFITRVIILGFGAKLIGAAARLTIMGDLYGGSGDFHRYLDNGRELSGVIRSGSLPDQARELGTPFLDFISGVVFTVVPAQLWVGFAVFATLAYIGAYLFFKAFQLAVPDGDHRRYAVLVFFLPTMVFWPSSIGKEAWLVFGLGIAAYGAARVVRRARWGYLILAIGGIAVYQVRPHMGALLALSFVAAFLMRLRDPEVRTGPVAWVIGLVIVGATAGFVYDNWGEAVPRDGSIEGSTADQVFAETDRRTSQGGSSFDSRPVRRPIDFLHAAVTVPFRPLPTEAHNLQSLVASFEGVALLLIVLLSLPRLASLPRRMLRQPYVLMAAVYCTGFIIAFSNVGNFGILTRQRAQLLPFLAVLLALPKLHGRADPVVVEAPVASRTGVLRYDPDDGTAINGAADLENQDPVSNIRRMT